MDAAFVKAVTVGHDRRVSAVVVAASLVVGFGSLGVQSQLPHSVPGVAALLAVLLVPFLIAFLNDGLMVCWIATGAVLLMLGLRGLVMILFVIDGRLVHILGLVGVSMVLVAICLGSIAFFVGSGGRGVYNHLRTSSSSLTPVACRAEIYRGWCRRALIAGLIVGVCIGTIVWVGYSSIPEWMFTEGSFGWLYYQFDLVPNEWLDWVFLGLFILLPAGVAALGGGWLGGSLSIAPVYGSLWYQSNLPKHMVRAHNRHPDCIERLEPSCYGPIPGDPGPKIVLYTFIVTVVFATAGYTLGVVGVWLLEATPASLSE